MNLQHLILFEMRYLPILSFLGVFAIATIDAVSLPQDVPRDVSDFRQKHPYKPPKHEHRKIIKIRASRDHQDDVSEDFERGVRQADRGNTLYLPHGQTFVIGKALDLTGLNDIHIHLEGEIRVSNRFRIANCLGT